MSVDLSTGHMSRWTIDDGNDGPIGVTESSAPSEGKLDNAMIRDFFKELKALADLTGLGYAFFRKLYLNIEGDAKPKNLENFYDASTLIRAYIDTFETINLTENDFSEDGRLLYSEATQMEEALWD